MFNRNDFPLTTKGLFHAVRFYSFLVIASNFL
nr:MAG TPA: hypothetical protein [Caudoviricetes sp.]